MLTQSRVTKVISAIISTELKLNRKRKQRSTRLISDAPTQTNTKQAADNRTCKGIPRVESAGQISLFDPETEGPKAGQTTRAVMANMPLAGKKDLFYVHCKDVGEEELKGEAELGKRGEECSSKEDIVLPSPFALTAIPIKHNKAESKLWIDFSVYKTKILKSMCGRYDIINVCMRN
eukprot:TRINITY_DN13291_c0_g3_i2.p1 TRINITY_DN13291_c0_g3~~TRINITY_DN13291_c0_g3_i2.p1  ORF type:complete len:177 (-),score=17.19 TRINITY_DN13291_c0_g3_i2:237-767(-)